MSNLVDNLTEFITDVREGRDTLTEPPYTDEDIAYRIVHEWLPKHSGRIPQRKPPIT